MVSTLNFVRLIYKQGAKKMDKTWWKEAVVYQISILAVFKIATIIAIDKIIRLI